MCADASHSLIVSSNILVHGQKSKQRKHHKNKNNEAGKHLSESSSSSGEPSSSSASLSSSPTPSMASSLKSNFQGVTVDEASSTGQGTNPLKSSLNIFSRFQSRCMKSSKSKKKKKKKKQNVFDSLHPQQINSDSQETEALKWDKLSPNEFETLQEYIQCKLVLHC